MRLRFAPSPTGALHIGGARTALYNWLLAGHEGATLLLRIEDTDRERSTEENVEQILDALRWLEIVWDEGPALQSAHGERHAQVLQALLDAGLAYHSNATAEDVKAYKERHGAASGFRGQPHEGGAVRLRVPDSGVTVVHDVIRGDTVFEHAHLDEPVIARADGSALYNFAVAIDDYDAGVTHVVRGEDHLSNTPKQLLVMEALQRLEGAGSRSLPLFAHLPLLHGPDGKKLSKRHGAASVQELRAEGYLPAAVRNYMALLGWGTGDDATVLETGELIERFTLERVSRNPARFDVQKLRWLNGVHIRRLPVEQLADQLRAFFAAEQPERLAAAASEDFPRAVQISQEKIHTLADFWPLSGFFFEQRPIDEKAAAKWLGDAGGDLLQLAAERLGALPAAEFSDPVAIERTLAALLEQQQCKPGTLYQPLRVAISGGTISPGIFESLALLGRERSLQRIERALQR